jgi:hypothetical protein
VQVASAASRFRAWELAGPGIRIRPLVGFGMRETDVAPVRARSAVILAVGYLVEPAERRRTIRPAARSIAPPAASRPTSKPVKGRVLRLVGVDVGGGGAETSETTAQACGL